MLIYTTLRPRGVAHRRITFSAAPPQVGTEYNRQSCKNAVPAALHAKRMIVLQVRRYVSLSANASEISEADLLKSVGGDFVHLGHVATELGA